MRYYAIRDEGWPDLVVVLAKNGRVVRTYWKENAPYPDWDNTKQTDAQLFAIDRLTDFDNPSTDVEEIKELDIKITRGQCCGNCAWIEELFNLDAPDHVPEGFWHRWQCSKLKAIVHETDTCPLWVDARYVEEHGEEPPTLAELFG